MRSRRIRPTRDGWWCLAASLALGIAAVNTGNNLLYLLVALLLGAVLASGFLSELTLWGLTLELSPVEEAHVGRPFMRSAGLTNTKRWLASHSVALEAKGPTGETWRAYLPYLGPGAEQILTWEETCPRRGRQSLTRVGLVTRFPLGLFEKSRAVTEPGELIVFPALRPREASELTFEGGVGEQPSRRPGRGPELYNLRPYQVGDEPRFVHWPSSAKTGVLMLREFEAPTQLDTRIVLVGAGVHNPERLEHGLSEAASLAVALLRSGAAVELLGPGLLVPAATGRSQERRLLTALALFDPDLAARAPGRPASPVRLRELRVALG